MLKNIRRTLAILFAGLLTLMLLDFTGTLHAWLGWMAKVQFLPAVLALNVGVIVFLVLLTLIFGRVYCSVICPLGVFQDLVSWLAGKRKKNRFRHSKAINWLRYGMLALFVVAIVAGINSFVVLFAPYSAYGRMVSALLQPIYIGINNLLAQLAERMDSYAFYTFDVWMKSLPVLIVAIATFIVVAVLAWRGGRTWCNTICPVGTILGFLSRFSWLKPVIDTDKCNGCGLCERNCKASCINSREHAIDYSRCVACMDCIDKCKRGAIKYARRTESPSKPMAAPSASDVHPSDNSRRAFLATAAAVAATAALKAEEKKVDGGLAEILDKKVPERQTPILPPGALTAKHFAQHCTACQLCVSACPNGVLRPATSLDRFMQPELSYERGYCRPECTRCSEVCPAGAIQPITREEKSSTQVGHAVWIRKNCIVLTDDVNCGNCQRHCPTGAIQMVPSDENNPRSRRIPVIDVERCIGCGACENLCPARPYSAIYVEGHLATKTI